MFLLITIYCVCKAPSKRFREKKLSIQQVASKICVNFLKQYTDASTRNKCTQNETAHFTRAAGELVAAAIKEHTIYIISCLISCYITRSFFLSSSIAFFCFITPLNPHVVFGVWPKDTLNSKDTLNIEEAGWHRLIVNTFSVNARNLQITNILIII